MKKLILIALLALCQTANAESVSITHGLIFNTGTSPTIANNACGSTSQGTVAVGSTNNAGTVTVGTAAVTSCVISFSATQTVAPKCVIAPANAVAAVQGTTLAYVSAQTTTSFTITGAALASASYTYHCF